MNLMDKIAAFLKQRSLYVRPPGAGVARADARLADHRRNFSHVDLTPIPSRQQRRAAERAEAKALQHVAKQAAMSGKRQGGAAAVR